MRILMTGASGLIGKKLAVLLRGSGHEVLGVTRSRELCDREKGQWLLWQNPESGSFPLEYLEGLDGIINLAGEPISGQRWTPEQKLRIRDSRVLTTRSLVDAIGSSATRPAFLVSASAIGFYGDRGDESLSETSTPGTGFLPDVCVEWEAETNRAKSLGLRVVNVRVGIVLSLDGGALAEMKGIFNFGLGGSLGSGRQWFPWIHISDITGLFQFVTESNSIQGPVNGVAPNPVRNSEFTLKLANAMRRPAILPVPGFAIRALWGEMAELLLGGARVVPDAATKYGYQFRFPELAAALQDLMRS